MKKREAIVGRSLAAGVGRFVSDFHLAKRFQFIDVVMPGDHPNRRRGDTLVAQEGEIVQQDR